MGAVLWSAVLHAALHSIQPVQPLHHWSLQEHQYSVNSEWQGGHWTNWAAMKPQAGHRQDQGLTPPRG